jgi:hypothetical protein
MILVGEGVKGWGTYMESVGAHIIYQTICISIFLYPQQDSNLWPPAVYPRATVLFQTEL